MAMLVPSVVHRAGLSRSNVGSVVNNISKRTNFTWAEPFKDDTERHNPEDVFRAGMRHHHICNTAWPIGHSTTIKPYRVPRLREQNEIKATLQGAYGDLDKMMLYVHVPFCQTRCQFCEYTVVDPKHGKQEDQQNYYFDALMDEFRLYDEVLDTKKKKLVGFDIGGGTPSMASIQQIERIMNAANKHFQMDTSQFEISIETTPKIAAAEPDKIRAYKQMGIRRISMGLQTTDFKQAKQLGRDDANASTAYLYKAVDNIRAAGFESFNIDLMYGFPLPLKGEDPFPTTVKDTINLNPEHITLYRMRYKGTKMAHLAGRVGLQQVNMQEGLAREALINAGYHGLVGKNTFSRLNQSSGCSDYLDLRVVKAVPYLGYGLGAQSFSHHTLQYNLGAVTKAMHQYIKSLELNRLPIQDLYHLSREAAQAKMTSVSFYFGGIDLEAFKSCFGVSLETAFSAEMEFLASVGLMKYSDDKTRFQMTPNGKKHFGGVVALFYSPAVKKYVMNLPGGEEFVEDPVAVLRRQQTAAEPFYARSIIDPPRIQTPLDYSQPQSTNLGTSFLEARATKNAPSA
jgi:oxygen-independent coproporphyrinogen-3 oxidase